MNIQEDKELQTEKFPNCRGTFDDCPSDEEFEETLKNKIVLKKCKVCPVYLEK